MKKKISLLLTALLAGALSLGAYDAPDAMGDKADDAKKEMKKEAMKEGKKARVDVVDTAIAAGKFNTLVAAVQAAGLVDTLKTAENITVFAPTDEAFEALPEGTVEMLLKPENKDTLVKILTYHVVGQKLPAKKIAAGEVETLEGSMVEITTDDGVMVNGAKVIKANVMASNGIIHVIDAVILPPDVSL